LNQSFDALHEEIAAARAPGVFPFLTLLASLILPLAAAMWMLIRAERSIVSADETLRTLARYGLSERVIRLYLERQPPRRLPDGEATRADPPELPQPPTTRGAG
jgi:hypothetical protein